MLRDIATFGTQLAAALQVDLPGPPAAGDDLFVDWGLDSLQAFQLLICIETMAEAWAPPLEIPMIFTLGDAHAYYLSLCDESA